MAAAAARAKAADLAAIQTGVQGDTANLLMRYGQQQALTPTVAPDLPPPLAAAADPAAAAATPAAPAAAAPATPADELLKSMPWFMLPMFAGSTANSPLLQQQLKFA